MPWTIRGLYAPNSRTEQFQYRQQHVALPKQIVRLCYFSCFPLLAYVDTHTNQFFSKTPLLLLCIGGDIFYNMYVMWLMMTMCYSLVRGACKPQNIFSQHTLCIYRIIHDICVQKIHIFVRLHMIPKPCLLLLINVGNHNQLLDYWLSITNIAPMGL